MQVKRWLITALVVAVCTLPTTSLAQPAFRPHGHEGGMPVPLMMILKQANLTTDQQNQVHQIMSANWTAAKPLIQQLHSIQQQIADKFLSTGSVTAADFAPLQQQENQIHQQLDQQMLNSALQIRGLLTPDQLAKVSNLHNQLESLRQQIRTLLGQDATEPAGD
jgi:Spy/CpxP family protein refolding chaperone